MQLKTILNRVQPHAQQHRQVGVRAAGAVIDQHVAGFHRIVQRRQLRCFMGAQRRGEHLDDGQRKAQRKGKRCQER